MFQTRFFLILIKIFYVCYPKERLGDFWVDGDRDLKRSGNIIITILIVDTLEKAPRLI
jgi:hypothetical protein